MKTTYIKLALAGLLALLGVRPATLSLRGDSWIAIVPSGTNLVLTWSNSAAALEQSLTLSGSWTTVEGAVSPYLVSVTNWASFYRLRLSLGGPFDFRYLAPTFTAGIGDPSGGCGCTAPENPNSLVAGGRPQDNGLGSVFLHTGELNQHAVDLEVPGRGFHWRFERRYRSGMQYDGPLGHGWDFNYNQRLVVQGNGDVLRVDGLGRVDRYVLAAGSYESPSAFYTRLARNLDGSYDERDRHGMVHSFSATNGVGVARLARKRDRNGNQMTFQYNPLDQLTNVVDTLGRSIAYSYDVNGRLTQVTDFIGRSLRFSYDANGDLATVTSPAVTGTPNGNDFPLGKTTRYTYSSGSGDARFNHNLLTVTAPNEVAAGGPPRLVAQYDTNPASTNADRVVSLFLGGTNASGVAAGGTISYRHASLGGAPSNDFNTAVFQTTVTSRNGNGAEYWFNQLGNVVRQIQFTRGLRPGEPPGYTNLFEYNRDGELTRHLSPEGNSAENTYDSANPDRFQQGNLLQVRRLPGPRGGDQTQLVTSQTFEPLFNQVRTLTEPCGNDPAYVPPNGGNNSPGRYTRTNFYDYQESALVPAEATAWGIAIPPALLGLGDLNDDGATNQSTGNLVRRVDPIVNLLAGSNQALAEGDSQQEVVTRYLYNGFGQLTQTEDARGNITTFGYFPENDPDGDGTNLIAGRDPVTGGYLSQSVRDASAGPRRQDPLPAVAITNRFERDPVGNATRRIDGRGYTNTFAYNALNQVVQEEKPKLDASQSTGYLIRYLYDANNNRTGLDIQNVTTDPANHLPLIVADHPFSQHRFTYDMLDQLVEETRDATRDPAIPFSAQPEQLVTRYRLDANGNRTRVFSPLAAAGAEPDNYESFSYDERDLLFTFTRGGTSPQASTRAYDYDANGNLVRWTDAEDNDALPGPESEVTAYDGFDRRLNLTDRAGIEQRFAYDPADRIVLLDSLGPATVGAATNTLLSRTAMLYDEAGRTFQVDRALFMAAGVTQVVATTLADGPLTPGDGNVSERYEYDALDRLTFRVEDDSAVYRTDYDGAGRRIRHTLPLVDNVTPGGPFRTTMELEYDRNDNLVRRLDTQTNPQGLVPPAQMSMIYVYDPLNRLVRLTDSLGQTRYSEYDSRDNVVSAYDARGALIPDPLGIYVAGNINDRGNATRFAYDGLNRRWREAKELSTTGDGNAPRDLTNPYNPDGLVALLEEHDANSRITSRTDDATNRTVYAYDTLNRLVAQTNADGGLRTWQYDRDHNPVSLRDENNTAHLFVYDGLNRQVAHHLSPDPAKTNSAGLPLLAGTTLQTFAYDGLSRLIRSTDNNEPGDPNDDWTVEARFDSLGRLVEEVQNGRAVSAGYLSADRSDLHYPAGNRVVHFAYDPHHQLIALSNTTSLAITISSLGAFCPPPLLYTFAPSNLTPSLVVTQTFDANRRVTQVQEATTGAGTIGFHSFTYNRENHLTGAARVATTGVQTLQENLSLALDSLERQKGFSSQLIGPGGASIKVRQQTINGAQDVREVRDQFNQLVQQVAYSPTHEPADSFLVHNASPGTGIRTRDTNFIYQWDGLNRLRVVRPRTAPANEVARYTYDAHPAIHESRRVQATVTNSMVVGGRSTTRFYYDGVNCLEETIPGSPERVLRQFLFGSRLDEVLAMDADTNGDGNPDQLSFYLRDRNNNITQLVDASGLPVEFYFYDDRGRPSIFSAATGQPLTNSLRGNPWLFTGQRWDAATSLYHFKARPYDPLYGLFLSRDPLGLWHDPANHGNPMIYPGNQPWNLVDPTGTEGTDWAKALEALESALKKAKEVKEQTEEIKQGIEALDTLIKAIQGDAEAKNKLIEGIGESALDAALKALEEKGLLASGWAAVVKAGADFGNALGQFIAKTAASVDCAQRCKACGFHDQKVSAGCGALVVIKRGDEANTLRDDVWCRLWNGRIYAKCPYKIPASFVREACSALGVTPGTTVWQWTECRDW